MEYIAKLELSHGRFASDVLAPAQAALRDLMLQDPHPESPAAAQVLDQLRKCAGTVSDELTLKFFSHAGRAACCRWWHEALCEPRTVMNAERYTVEHETRYAYGAPVSQSWQPARLTPRMLPWQRLLSHSLQIDPPADERRDELDSFGNMVTHFGLHGAHRMLRVRMECLVEVMARPSVQSASAAALLPIAVAGDRGQDPVKQKAARELGGGARRDPARAAAGRSGARKHERADAARALVRRRAPVREQVLRARPAVVRCGVDLMHRIHADFEFEPGATTVSTSVDEVLYQRRGVCQDFAHLMLACLRGLGLPARYVSGYLLTDPPPGMPRLMGADASHAWVRHLRRSTDHRGSTIEPNNQLADQRYITLTWGADFADVVPLRGVILGGGDQLMDVEVSVIPA